MGEKYGRFDDELEHVLRNSIKSGRSIRSIAREAKIGHNSINNFLIGQIGISLSTASQISDILPWGPQVEFLENEQKTFSRLLRLVNQANEQIAIVGNDDSMSLYLDRIEAAVSVRGVEYKRLLNSSSPPISPEMRQHLKTVAAFDSVELRIASSDYNLQNLVIAADKLLLDLGGQRKWEKSIQISGETFLNEFGNYFSGVFTVDGTTLASEYGLG